MNVELPDPLLDRVRAVCLAVPGAREEPAWTGVRWKERGRTFAHLVAIVDGKPEGLARATRTKGPIVVLLVRSDHPPRGCFRVRWVLRMAGLVVTPSTPTAQLKALVAARALPASGAAGSAAAPRRARRAPRR